MTLGDQERYKEYEFEKEIRTLKAQIEKMKCCENCKHRRKLREMEILGLDKEPCNVCNKHDKWEIYG